MYVFLAIQENNTCNVCSYLLTIPKIAFKIYGRAIHLICTKTYHGHDTFQFHSVPSDIV